MRCEQIRPWLRAYGEGSLPSYKAAWVSQHLAWCAECAAESVSHKPLTAAPQPAVAFATAQVRPTGETDRDQSGARRPTARWLRRTAFLSVVAAAAVLLASRFHLIR